MQDANAIIKDLVARVPRGWEMVPLKKQTPPEARWMSPETIIESEALAYDPDNPGGKILLGALGDRLVGIDDNRHVLTVAGSRAGKSVSVINNLIFYRGSVLCTDPKGELANKTAARRAELGQKVCILDPFERCHPSVAHFRKAYNPLSALKPDSPTLIEDAGLIADAMVVVSGKEKDPHWDESAKHFIEGVILHVVTEPRYAGKRNLLSVREQINLALTRALDDEDDPDGLYGMRLEAEMCENAARIEQEAGPDEPHRKDLAGAIDGAARAFYERREGEQTAVLSTVRRHTKFLDYPGMRRVLAGNDFELAELKNNPDGVSVYLCLPAGRMGSCSRWLRVFINQLLDAMEREKTRPGSPPVLACLDEFPVLGFMSQLQDAVGQVASFDLKLWVIVQDWGQGKSLYGDRWESFAANAGIIQAFSNSDLTTAEYLSRRLGKTPVEVTRHSEAGPEQRAKGVSGRNVERVLYDLMAPEEITRIFSRNDELKRQLVHWAGEHPMILQRVEYYDEDSPVYGWFEGKFADIRSGADQGIEMELES